ncbi:MULTISPECIES: response regulator [unclassified Mesorhizobium]|uniref:response regulator transcription factor n=1 Tax=unclassified Mesorhizobium TaxID=325217 RepID=UPI000FD8EC2E|nr:MULTISPECIES: response regulator [unclassified Mesorhizobium]TGQ08680.1 response regulator [Mesorhizobium sp. M2E.F.Ca.ET.219.01.1.1]TGS09646.1 response regulator [Mesorhizobium sp. M2E.F.Ca.ET.209.01.1.1]TGT69215.1 response regulator [Mesorhizobium sp. M2E.F.Ca.ET.166.01.1.1]TGW01548.1 response regulator [Mesorhizobium sp. M2E.F.Ca.ET.154.01.1.1]
MHTNKIVFVVDDDLNMLKGLERLLSAHGFDVQMFQSAEDFQARARPDDAVALVLDVGLTGKSGIDLGRELVASEIFLPVIFITADDSEATRKATMELGCIASLTKPFSAKSLIDAVERASSWRNPLS